MQETKVLYTANERKLDWARIFRWVDGVAFFGILLAIGVVFWAAISSGDPDALWFARVTTWGMGVAVAILSLMLLINAFGRWGWLGLVPLALLGAYWVTGELGQAIYDHWGEALSTGGWQVLKIGLYALGGIIGLGLLARLIETVGVTGFIGTLAIAAGICIWFIG